VLFSLQTLKHIIRPLVFRDTSRPLSVHSLSLLRAILLGFSSAPEPARFAGALGSRGKGLRPFHAAHSPPNLSLVVFGSR
jgi:hypothetical protein